MITTETALRRTSEIRFITAMGDRVETPVEWIPCLLAVPCGDNWVDATVTSNGRHMALSVRRIAGETLAVVEWPRSGPGWYDVEAIAGNQTWSRRFRIAPTKITEGSFAEMLSDLEERLPVALAIALKDAGARIGVEGMEPQGHTTASDLARLRRAVLGSGRPGLASVLRQLGNDPHKMLRDDRIWVKRQHVRMPDPSGLVQALWKAGNMEDGLPQVVLDRRSEHTVDLYENRILKSFATEVERRLRRLVPILEIKDAESAAEADELLRLLVQAKRLAPFLSDVGELQAAPTRTTMVLMKRREYRAMYEGFLKFRSGTAVRNEDPRVLEPLENLPSLYQSWATLVSIQATLNAAVGAGYTLASQTLVSSKGGSPYLTVLVDNQMALELRNDHGDRLRVYPERSYSRSGAGLRSISFRQRPDLAIELERAGGATSVVLLDPKYKLDSEADSMSDGRPKKVDIDKMHAYRDSIRTNRGKHVVSLAATLYPGATKKYGQDVAAIRAYPGEADTLRESLESILSVWLNESHEQVLTA